MVALDDRGTTSLSMPPLPASGPPDVAGMLTELFARSARESESAAAPGRGVLVLSPSAGLVLVSHRRDGWMWLLPHSERTYVEHDHCTAGRAGDTGSWSGWVDSAALLTYLSATEAGYSSVRDFLDHVA